ncbi:hypothetical protein [Microbacterium sp. cx-59]|uniref:hypothetical protein n=1 Tax=Microbacterium sp. cx-59 TaxID=2891207 RepID=UPI001E2960A7|nr:hypothetical protein [Microbacterium sp. cx-59]MCC4908249.1 hypothetical protein [Microbacterium sp. cx-59]
MGSIKKRSSSDAGVMGLAVVAAATVVKVACVLVSALLPDADPDFLRSTATSWDMAVFTVLGGYFVVRRPPGP